MMRLFKTTLLVVLAILTSIHAVDAYAQKGKKPAKSTKSKTKTPSTKSTPAKPGQDTPASADKAEGIISPELEKADINVKPSALPATPFKFPTFEEFTLPNGLHVYVIENHEQPTMAVNMIFKGGDAADPISKEGVASMMADMLTKGSKVKSAAQIAEALDGVGAKITVNASGEAMTINGSALKKHSNLLVSTMAEVVLRPTFPIEELDKVKQQSKANVAYERSRPLEMAQALSRKVVYGMANPLARRKTEHSIDAITRNDVVNFHETYIRPNAASIAVVGDVNAAEVRKMLTASFGDWKRGNVPATNIPPITTEKPAVYFVPRKGAVQSSIVVCAAAPAVRDPEWMSANLLASYIGGGFGSALFNTLRETYSYTYSPFGFITRGGSYNRIAFGAEVRNAVTDSAINVILAEVAKIRNEGPDEMGFTRRVATEVGQYRMAFEKPATVAAILQNAWINGVPQQEAINQTSAMEQVSSADVQMASHRLLNTQVLRIVVVGSPDIKPKLEVFGAVKEFTTDLDPVEEKFESVSMSAAELLDAYEKALGGREAIAALRSLKIDVDAEMMLQGKKSNGTITRILMPPAKEHLTVNLGFLQQETWTDSKDAWISLNGGEVSSMDALETYRTIEEARIFPVLSLRESSYKNTVLGKKDGLIIMSSINPEGAVRKYFFDANTMLLVKDEKEDQAGNTPVVVVDHYKDYETVAGIKMPATLIIQNQWYTMTMRAKYTPNPPVSDSEFQPAAR